jgi:hypothetical protein
MSVDSWRSVFQILLLPQALIQPIKTLYLSNLAWTAGCVTAASIVNFGKWEPRMTKIRADNKNEVNSHICVHPRHPRFNSFLIVAAGRAGCFVVN